jgi:hypothetical protein
LHEYSIAWLIVHPWLVGATVSLVLIVLMVPYEIVSDSRSGQAHRRVSALLWAWEQAPGYIRLSMPGMLRLQQATLRVLAWLWIQMRERFLAGLRDLLRRWLA